MDTIRLRGVRTHNLKNISLELPRDKLIVITGLSGSGKSSLAFDTIYAEGQRRYVESLSAYARQFLSMMEKPELEHIEGLSPAISIEQKSTSHNPRSTVGTVTEIYDYLRLLFARVGDPRCPTHHTSLIAQTISQMVDQLLALPQGSALMLLAPIVKERKGEHVHIFSELQAQGYIRARVNGEIIELDNPPTLELHKKHTIDAVIDRFKIREDMRLRLAESLETALKLGNGRVEIHFMDKPEQAPLLFSDKFACPICGYSISELEPRLFSFNNPVGACPECDGLGIKQYFDPAKVVSQAHLSLKDGAIAGWDNRNAFYFQMLTAVAQHYQFKLDTPFNLLTDKQRHLILYGTGETAINLVYQSDKGTTFARKKPFEGILNNLERRYRETDSNAVREEMNKYISKRDCPVCHGSRLCEAARNVFVADKTLPELTTLPINRAQDFFQHLQLSGQQGEIADKILKEVAERLQFLINVGLDYLSLDRSADTLSGGEAQRIRLASQIGAGLVGVMYILDEPSIGLHQRDNQRLLDTLIRLRDLGNTVIVVEHDEDAIRAADHVVDMGPGAGVHGGYVVAQGTPQEITQAVDSLTGQYLSGQRNIPIPSQRQTIDKQKIIRLTGAKGNNLKNVTIEVPIGLMTCITGVSGSGKSTLINDTLYPLTAQRLNNANVEPAEYATITGLEHIDKVIDIDQSPIGRTPRSNPATYTGIFTTIRELFAATPESRSRGYQAGRFSFNVKGGRCEACQGDGVIKVEMHFLPDIYVTCDVCKSKRYNRETLDIHYKGKTIDDVLNITVEDALDFFSAVPMLARKLQTLMDVGLSYIRLGQNAVTLSGGEAQRVKLAKELSKRDTGKTLYLLDEPTTGLHFHDIAQLLTVLHRLREHGNTIVIIEHNLDVIKTADWIIDLGPEGGDKGGEIIATGTPEDIASQAHSYTGQFLRSLLGVQIKKSPEKKTRQRKK
ncbi:excinuclease ABC subunit UvrA [Beggiatoa leptomitoformis]|uniref:UvrABC system protein A n=1 Tax=Beggiatoa leptomitoformis TaxID=288004 RepID=A0A2N9YIT2_9GAMM|nr:excinuclease ABC subunit UvrA [Beggiatoa leptomitoformis]ALG67396.1 excinuclease ABC subunit UvrA [Beggiatoa leptomitoformis]AUI70393.1 excinuclease ABC subunit UvrA [Beggiatoa leptomitoformis]